MNKGSQEDIQSAVGRTIERDRKSTRLNSSHSQISYAVFCLKKKKQLCSCGLWIYLLRDSASLLRRVCSHRDTASGTDRQDRPSPSCIEPTRRRLCACSPRLC